MCIRDRVVGAPADDFADRANGAGVDGARADHGRVSQPSDCGWPRVLVSFPSVSQLAVPVLAPALDVSATQESAAEAVSGAHRAGVRDSLHSLRSPGQAVSPTLDTTGAKNGAVVGTVLSSEGHTGRVGDPLHRDRAGAALPGLRSVAERPGAPALDRAAGENRARLADPAVEVDADLAAPSTDGNGIRDSFHGDGRRLGFVRSVAEPAFDAGSPALDLVTREQGATEKVTDAHIGSVPDLVHLNRRRVVASLAVSELARLVASPTLDRAAAFEGASAGIAKR